MRINSLIRFSNGGEYEVAAPVHSPHIKGRRYSALEAKIPAEFDIYRTFPAKPPKKGLGWFFWARKWGMGHRSSCRGHGAY